MRTPRRNTRQRLCAAAACAFSAGLGSGGCGNSASVPDVAATAPVVEATPINSSPAKMAWPAWGTGAAEGELEGARVLPPSVAAVVRFRGAVGAIRKYATRMEGDVPALGKSSVLVLNETDQVIAARGRNWLQKAADLNLTSTQDDLGLRDKMEGLLAGYKEPIVMSPEGNIVDRLHLGADASLVSYNFPRQAVRAGSEWTGADKTLFETDPVRFRVREMDAAPSGTVAVIDYKHMKSDQTGTLWFDVQRGGTVRSSTGVHAIAPGGGGVEVEVHAVTVAVE